MNFEREVRRKAMGGILKLMQKEMLKPVESRRKAIGEAKLKEKETKKPAEQIADN